MKRLEVIMVFHLFHQVTPTRLDDIEVCSLAILCLGTPTEFESDINRTADALHT